ncbi:hypothetical protein DPM35_14015 [Mesorhizobium atlanticum]|uniref:Uncharacterized protein n=1 Tax=Mesorhizobium atlanticum TaxID=2233532 RepID=A0A330GSH6_9HYPH|nr:hypothetical protein DPM35_14015 [Mesorhizobium atlanticum]
MSLIPPDHPLLPSDLDQAPISDRVRLFSGWMEELGVHPLAAATFLAPNLFPNFIDRDVTDDLAQLVRLVEASDIAFAATDAGHLPCIMGMHQGPRGTSRPLLGLFRHMLK